MCHVFALSWHMVNEIKICNVMEKDQKSKFKVEVSTKFNFNGTNYL